MKKIILYLLVMSFCCYAQAQVEGCDGSRYIDDVFSEVKSTKGLRYGQGETLFGNFQELFLDVYEPEGDELSNRPVIIVAFGGSYIGGERGDLEVLCEGYARKGYVAVTIDYRLFDGPLFPFPTDNQMKRVVIKSVSDMKAAIRYMRQDADTENVFKIDPDLIFVGGVSAGSITAFHTAVIDTTDNLPEDVKDILTENGGIDGNSSDNFEYSSEVQGLVNFSGGLNDASWIDENDPPFVSVHDDLDPVVPYEGGFASIGNIPIIYMEGSKTCKEAADIAGVRNQLKTIENSDGHVSYLLNPIEIEENINYTANFLASIVCEGIIANTGEIASNLESVEVFPNPTNGMITIANTENSNYSIALFDVFGRTINSYSNTNTLDLNPYGNGIYFLKMADVESNEVKTFKVVVE